MENVQEGKPLNHVWPARPWCRGRDKWDGAGEALGDLVRGGLLVVLG